MAEFQPLFSALEVFSGAPDKASLDAANTWLLDFQHSPEAWVLCNRILSSPDAPPAAKLFAAQTFRTKVIYDLQQVPQADLPALRDTLLAALQEYHAGPRTIIIQLSLAVAGLALQFPAWADPVQNMVDHFGRNPACVPVLLHFLTHLPEEVNNTRIPVTDDEWKERSPALLASKAKTILELLGVYMAADGVTPTVQNQVFTCIRNWLVAGEIRPSELAATPLLGYAFDALASNSLFDSAADALVELIHETQEIDDNMPVIQLLVPRIIALKSELLKESSDPEKIKGYARIFSEAGETYRLLILQHTETFFPLVEAIGQCAAYPDLDIVPITFPFWTRLSQTMGKKSSISPLLLDAYKSLMNVMIRHLHFPPDSTPLSGQESETFRSFRHVMGDTLKDCCVVLKTETCILATHDLITAALSRGTDVSWQDLEAPLFALRAMGAEIDPNDNTAVPKVMDLILNLPSHPSIRYAVIMVIARYTEWTNAHPEYIPAQLSYISSGFEDPESQTSAGAGQALRYLCQDCKEHLVDVLPTLHNFLKTSGSKLVQSDRRQVYEAIAFVISAMPMEPAGNALREFSVDILQKIHAVTSKTTPATKAELLEICNDLENLESMLDVVKGFGDELPTACKEKCSESWGIFDHFLLKYGLDSTIADRSTRVIRHGISLFGRSALSVAPSVVARMSFAFETTGSPSYMWIASKVIAEFGHDEGQDLRGSFQEVYERSTNKVASLLQEHRPDQIPDVLEDYVYLLLPLSDFAPDIFFTSSAFSSAFRIVMLSLPVIQSEVVFRCLELLRVILTHDCLRPDVPTPPNFPVYANAIHTVIGSLGYELVGYLVGGIVGEFEESVMSAVVSIFRAIATYWPGELLSWIGPLLQQLPNNTVSTQTKEQFVGDVNRAVTAKEFDKVKYAVLSLRRSSRKARERRNTSAMESH